ncbi:MAG: hypothetical protein EXR62_01730 [Chloroflexi bacterium]|nr:hypothetical protein [Chloroflexota bacterium]
MSTDIDKMVQRVNRYWYEDGIGEIFAGFLLVLIGLTFWLQGIVPSGSPLAAVSALAFPVVVIGGMWIGNRLVKGVKNRLIYPRTGYVSYQRPNSGSSRWLTGVIGAFMAALVALLFVTYPISLLWLPALQGLLVGIFLIYLGNKVNLIRFYLLAAISTLIGAILSLHGVGDPMGSAAYFACMGIVLATSGGGALYRYFQQTRPLSEQE